MNKYDGKPVFAGEILLCEDNRMNQELISERFARAGLKTVIAENGKDGVNMVENRIKNGMPLFAMIFMDIHMPVMNGLQAAAEISTLKTGVPIIAMTANVSPADREIYSAHGMHDCLGKPFTAQQLSDCLIKYLTPVSLKDEGEAPVRRDDERLKIKLIHNFMRNNETKYQEIVKAIDEGDIRLAHRLAHTLKGNAGIMGKARLQRAAESVEHLLSNEETEINRFTMSVLEAELEAVLGEYAPLIDEIPLFDEIKPEKLDEGKIQALFVELEALLDGGSMECLNLIYSLRLIPGSEELIQQMEHFEFEKALETLVKLKEEM